MQHQQPIETQIQIGYKLEEINRNTQEIAKQHYDLQKKLDSYSIKQQIRRKQLLKKIMVISWLAVSILGVAAFFPLIAIVSLPTFKALMMTVVTICPFLVNTMGYIFGLTVLHSKALLASLGLGILVSSVSAFFTSFQMYKADPKRKILTNELEQRQKIQLDEELEWHKIKKIKNTFNELLNLPSNESIDRKVIQEQRDYDISRINKQITQDIRTKFQNTETCTRKSIEDKALSKLSTLVDAGILPLYQQRLAMARKHDAQLQSNQVEIQIGQPYYPEQKPVAKPVVRTVPTPVLPAKPTPSTEEYKSTVKPENIQAKFNAAAASAAAQTNHQALAKIESLRSEKTSALESAFLSAAINAIKPK